MSPISNMPQSKHHHKAVRIAKAQDWLCAICGRPINKQARFGGRAGLSIDHVFPLNREHVTRPNWRSRKPEWTAANHVAAHGQCNSVKGHRPPTGCELIWLLAVDARLNRQSIAETRWWRQQQRLSHRQAA